MKRILVLGTNCNMEKKAVKTGASTTRLHYTMRGSKYSKIKHWVETNDNGCCRYCHSSYDEHRGKWTNPVKEKYYQFVAIYFDYGKLKKLYVHKNLHDSYITEYLDKYRFDDKQLSRLKHLIETRKTGVKHYGTESKTNYEKSASN